MSFVAGSGQGNCIFPYFGLELIKTLLLYFNIVLDIYCTLSNFSDILEFLVVNSLLSQ